VRNLSKILGSIQRRERDFLGQSKEAHRRHDTFGCHETQLE